MKSHYENEKNFDFFFKNVKKNWKKKTQLNSERLEKGWVT